MISDRMAGIEKTLIRRMTEMADPSCLNLGLGEPRFPTPRAILDHVRDHCRDWPLGYTPNEGYRELRELIALAGGRGAAADQVCVTCGAQEAIFAALMVLINPGDEILVPDPGYPAYASIVRICGGIPRPYRLEASSGFALDLKEIEKTLSPKTKALVLNNPHNPTGAVYSDEDIRRLAAVCDDRKIPIVSDEVYGAIYFRNPPASPAAYSKRVIVVDSLSKTFSMTGWRLGWCILPPELMKSLAALHQLTVSCASALSQHAAMFALRGGADAEKEANLREMKRRRDLIMDVLRRHSDLPFIEPAGAFYIMADVSGKAKRFGNSFEIARTILSREKVVTIPGSAFGPGGEGYLRLSFAAGPDEIEEGVRRIGQFLS